MALNAATGGKHKPQKQSGLTGIASSFLGGQGSHGSGGHSGGGGGIAGQLVGSLLGGGKPHGQQSSAQHSGAGGGSAGAHQQGGLIGLASGFLGGHPGSTVCYLSIQSFSVLIVIEPEYQLRLLGQPTWFRWWVFSSSAANSISTTKPTRFGSIWINEWAI